MRKRRTRQHVIADLGVNYVERQALLCGYAVERIFHDYGIDRTMSTYDANGEAESGEILIQAKATDNLSLRADVERWLQEIWHCILILYDAQADIAYWLYIQAYFGALPAFDIARAHPRVTVYIPTDQVLDPEAVRRFARFRDAVQAQLREVIHDEA